MSIGSPASRSSWITEPRPSRRISCTIMFVRPSSTETGRLRSRSMLIETSPVIGSAAVNSAKSASIGWAAIRFIVSISDIVAFGLRVDIVQCTIVELAEDLHRQTASHPSGHPAEARTSADQHIELGIAGDARRDHGALAERRQFAHAEPEIGHPCGEFEFGGAQGILGELPVPTPLALRPGHTAHLPLPRRGEELLEDRERQAD